MTMARRLTDAERIEARHWLQQLSEQARKVRDAMDPRHGHLAITDETWAAQWASLRQELDDFTGRVTRNEPSPGFKGGIYDRNA
jgi:hypothetical protein